MESGSPLLVFAPADLPTYCALDRGSNLLGNASGITWRLHDDETVTRLDYPLVSVFVSSWPGLQIHHRASARAISRAVS